jgi:hypothetical protein
MRSPLRKTGRKLFSAKSLDKFTQKKGNHHCGLKGSDAAARFVYAQQAAFDFNDVSMCTAAIFEYLNL